MHLLPTIEIRLDDGEDAVDLALPPGDVLVLSFTDSDLSALAVTAVDSGLSVRLAPLRRLKHPLSVDFLIEKTAAQCRFVLLRCLGGLDYWRYGIEQLGTICRERGIPLAILPGDERDDPRLGEHATVPAEFAVELLAYFRVGGGTENMRRLLGRIEGYLADQRQRDSTEIAPVPLPSFFALGAGGRPLPWRAALAALPPDHALVPVLLYRSGVAAGDTAMGEAIASSLTARGLAPLPLALTSLKDPTTTAELAALIAIRKPALIITTTAFSAREGADFLLDGADCPILQAVPVGSPREAWEASPRGLSAADLAMQVALPEFDGRIGAVPVAFKAEQTDPATGLSIRRLVPDPEGIAALTDLAESWVALARKPVAERRLALVMSDYPARGGRAGFAVGLDTPASVAAIRELLAGAGYEVGEARPDSQTLMAALTTGSLSLSIPLAAYRDWLATIPAAARETLVASHGTPEADPACRDGVFHFRAVRHSHLTVALQPARDATPDRKARYHDPDAPPGHGYLAFYLALRQTESIDALIHLGTHGTLEWLPGKAVALSTGCWPRLAIGGLPVVYPYVVDDPGEAAPAKRRLSALTLGHLPPPLAETEAAGEAALLRDLVEEFSQAQVLDPRRADIVASEIRARAEASGLAASCGVAEDTEMNEALTRLDAHLCDIAELPFRDGLHVFGRSAIDAVSARNERDNLLAALDGRFVPPGPAGSPHRGRPDVLPTGRNLSTLDPRAIPTRAAARLGKLAAQAVVSRHLQDHGDYPRRIVMDLWASPTLRSGGEDIAHALALMGVEPIWDNASTRVTGFSIVPQPKLAYPRLDVTVRISGTFRDTFPGQISLLDQAARAVAALDETDDWNEPAAARRRGEYNARIFGAAPGRYGAAMADRALDGDWTERAELGAAYLAASDHAYGGPEGVGSTDAGFAERIRASDAFIHVSDTAGRDILEASSAADVIGGLAAAAKALGADPALYSLDSSNPEAPKARTLAEDIARIVHGRLTHPRWIAGQLAHGWRGAAELAEAVDTLFVFAASTDAVADGLFDAVFQAYCADPQVWSALETANAPAAASIRSRLAEAARRGLWNSRRNSVGAFLAREAAE
ncbi:MULTISPECIES: cobaltochelatase subunit CobN [Bosea]|uniref:cobaltochelatase subunit CobN n=1 Tax=Bosea TaxID=85413 RepID=UPI00214FC9E1|nr:MULTISPECIES: cobaltochelatase subunit CobN [Bosea]MCR4523147.1 cobaltochelatase subunit CobN [Bosea sp. 47.2.35]MDR6829833.1 cobaltochelatase CobN [Bosea robiniae]MDR6896716.1 cobaltochelatase CobN [Bosea sp. BE109]MDR7140262.1 cobaltochelatase CobN [Bosea sp. BE168]MDR7176959.1 cobaltochelatase CobN [Bosea sp. BE271]